MSIKDAPSDYNSQNGNIIDEDYLASSLSWADNDYKKNFIIGKHDESISTNISFTGYLGGVSISCRNAGSNYID